VIDCFYFLLRFLLVDPIRTDIPFWFRILFSGLLPVELLATVCYLAEQMSRALFELELVADTETERLQLYLSSRLFLVLD
jgi:hypothetical protein